MNSSPQKHNRLLLDKKSPLYNQLIFNTEEKNNERLMSEEFNLERDLRSTQWIIDKAKNNADYAQNIYAALCNNEFVSTQIFEYIADTRWSCSWRYAGGIVADMIEHGDYMDYYCSGIGLFDEKSTSVNEGTVTDEIRDDFFKLGWIIKSEKN